MAFPAGHIFSRPWIVRITPVKSRIPKKNHKSLDNRCATKDLRSLGSRLAAGPIQGGLHENAAS